MKKQNSENTAKNAENSAFSKETEYSRVAKNNPEKTDPTGDTAASVEVHAGATATPGDPCAIDWADLADQRVLRLWQVAALAAGLPIMRSRRAKMLERDPARKQKYGEIKRYLRRKLTRVPVPGMVTRFNRPPNLFNANVDVLTAIQLLKAKYQDLPAEFIALEVSLKAQPIPTSTLIDSEPSSAGDVVEPVKKPHRDQKESSKTKADERLQLAILGMAMGGYGLRPEDSAGLKKVVDDIHNDLVMHHIPEFGLSTTNLLGTLNDGIDVLRKKGRLAR